MLLQTQLNIAILQHGGYLGSSHVHSSLGDKQIFIFDVKVKFQSLSLPDNPLELPTYNLQ